MSCRFLIEYLAAKPPIGLRPMSLALYDRLLALAAGVITFGLDSDLLKYELADLGIAILPSGRLGMDRTAHAKAMDSFYASFAEGEVARATESATRVSPRKSLTLRSPSLIERLDEAAAEEFGESLTGNMELLNAASAVAARTPDSILALPYEEAVSELAAALNWEADRVRFGISTLSLASRNQFLKPQLPFVPADVYPWRFNRALSYLRRPFVVRDTSAGPRSSGVVGRSLTHLHT